jgi:sulfatase modifying factor 1
MSTAPPLPPAPAAPWASAAGADHHGAWADIDVAGVVQRLRWLRPGHFRMGAPAGERGRLPGEGPPHEVTLSAGFWMADTPVTQALFRAVMGVDPSRFSAPPALRRPVERVGWDEAVAFTRRLGALLPPGAPDDGLLFQLPSEAQWEYACRAGTTGPTYLGPGQRLHDAAWFTQTAKGSTQPVGMLLPNPWGLYDTLGNVWEWCADAPRPYADPAPDGPCVDPLGPAGPSGAPRGGSWGDGAARARAACRDARGPPSRYGALGLRLSRGAPHRWTEGGVGGG